MKRVSRILALTALVIAAGGGATATAAPPQPPPGLIGAAPPIYLALGDSITNGENSDAPTNVAEYWSAVAKWRQDGYVTPFRAYLKGALNCLPAASNAAGGCGELQLVNLARSAIPAFRSDPGKPGVTTQLFIDEQLSPAEKVLTARNKDDNPRNDVEVVTLTVGGNEIFDAFMTGNPQAIAEAFGTFIANYDTILSGLRAAAGPTTPIMTMTYFNPLPYCGLPQYGDAADYILEGLPTPYGNGLNGVIRNLSAAHGAMVAEVFGRLGSGDFANCKHPNTAGYVKVTQAFETAWQTAER